MKTRHWNFIAAAAVSLALTGALAGCSDSSNTPSQAILNDTRVVDFNTLDADGANEPANAPINNDQVNMPGPDEVNAPVSQAT